MTDAPTSYSPTEQITDDAEPVEGSAAGTNRPSGSLASRILIAPIRWYQVWISPSLPPSCRFTPSCSAYAVGALREHGAVRGLWLAVRRLGKCHPWHAGGYDPVPARKGTTRERSHEAREA